MWLFCNVKKKKREGGKLYRVPNKLNTNKMKELIKFIEKYSPNTKYAIEGDNIKIDGHLYLSYKNISELPKSFGNLKIEGSLHLSDNNLTKLPKSFGNLKIEGSLNLSDNKLTKLPKSFGNPKIGGSLYLDNNILKTRSKQ